ncbi:hypothetical protein [Kitasatospora mediocidica]|nr:hypothetical protein [Kitasatospora mediocidica]
MPDKITGESPPGPRERLRQALAKRREVILPARGAFGRDEVDV